MKDQNKRFKWIVQNDATGETCTYNAACGLPVTKEHVRTSPKVLAWASNNKVNVYSGEELKSRVE